MLWLTAGIDWFHRVSDAIDEVSDKLKSLYWGLTAPESVNYNELCIIM
jgi:hypothetical protein